MLRQSKSISSSLCLLLRNEASWFFWSDYFSVTIPYDVLNRILSLEKVVGCGDTTDSCVAAKIISDKFEFHHKHRDAIMQIQQER